MGRSSGSTNGLCVIDIWCVESNGYGENNLRRNTFYHKFVSRNEWLGVLGGRVGDMMIEISKHPDFKYIADNPGVSRYEIWYNKRDLVNSKLGDAILSKRRYLLAFIGYILLSIIPPPAGIIAMYIGISDGIGHTFLWGLFLFLGGIIYGLSSYKQFINMENHLYSNGIGAYIDRWSYKFRKPLMKRLGKRYWFAYLPFSAIEYIETKDLTSETSALLIHTKDGKVWPHPKYGIPYNRTLKGDIKFVNEILEQYDKWKSKSKG